MPDSKNTPDDLLTPDEESKSMCSEPDGSFTIVCGGTSFQILTNIARSQSDFFDRMLNGPFMEATTRTVELRDDYQDDVARMVTFFYCDDYDELSESEYPDYDDGWDPNDPPCNHGRPGCHYDGECVPSQLTNVAMYALAEKYLIPQLKALAVAKFKAHPVDGRCWVHELSENEDGFADPWLADVIREIYTSTPSSDRGLRDAMEEVYLEYDHMIEGGASGFLDEIFKQLPEANVDYLMAKLASTEKLLATEEKEKITLQKKLMVTECNRCHGMRFHARVRYEGERLVGRRQRTYRS